MIHYTIQGKGNPLVLIHGFPNDSSAWNTIVPELAKRYQVILPDLPGAGNNPLPDTELTMEYLAASIKEVLDKEGIAKAVLAGHSMGGYTAMQFAASYPEMIQGISLVHSLASGDTDEKKENRRKAIALMRKGEAEREMFLKGMSQNLFADEFAGQHPEEVKKVVANGMKISAEALAGFYQAIMNRTDKRPLLINASWPMQWIIGNEDNATPLKDALEQSHIAPVNVVSIYKPCGHMSFVEMPQRLTADIQFFMDYCYDR
ncbi:MAG: alpha/beta hydrolase [Taibaiella sp.]|jgi:pimeloyl-ACP methyl ester carboxylesterase